MNTDTEAVGMVAHKVLQMFPFLIAAFCRIFYNFIA